MLHILHHHRERAVSDNNNANITKKKWTEVVLGAHAISTVHSLLFSTLFMIAMQTGIHFYCGTMGGLFIQSIMGPLNGDFFTQIFINC